MARYDESLDDLLYKTYVTDCLMGIANGSTIKKRWIDFVYKPQEDSRSGGEIVEDVMKRAGLRFAQ